MVAAINGNCLGGGIEIAMCCHYPLTEKTSLEGLTGAETGIPTESEFVEAYCRLTHRGSIPNWNFYLAFSAFRLASIVQGVYKRGIIGTASSKQALEKGRLARQIADVAWSLIEKE